MQTAALAAALALPLAAHGGVIPAPAEVKPGDGWFGVDSTVVLHVPPGIATRRLRHTTWLICGLVPML